MYIGISKSQMQKIDELNIQAGVSVTRMMELSGLMIAKHAERFGPEIAILAGSGHNGGDALCAARHLINKGYNPTIFIETKKMKTDTKEQLNILKHSTKHIYNLNKCKSLSNYDLIVDGLFGYNLNRNPTGVFSKIIDLANDSKTPILSVDLPSGLDADGLEYTPVIHATETLCLSYPKKSCLSNSLAGSVYVAYMSVLPSVLKKLRIKPISFEKNEIKLVKRR